MKIPKVAFERETNKLSRFVGEKIEFIVTPKHFYITPYYHVNDCKGNYYLRLNNEYTKDNLQLLETYVAGYQAAMMDMRYR